MQRVGVLGPGGSGKSALAAQIDEIAALPVIELDTIFWQEGLSPTPRDQWIATQQRLAEANRWVMDGDLGPYDAVEVRLRASDTVVLFGFLDHSMRLASLSTIPRACRLLAMVIPLPPAIAFVCDSSCAT